MKTIAAIAVVLVFASGAAAAKTPTSSTAARADHLRQTARAWETVIGLPHARTRRPAALSVRFWRHRLRAVERVASHPPHKSGWLCIHRFEGSWSDSGDPYWGGLQMDRNFMRTYATKALLRKGWANRWTALEQMWVAERAHRSGRGYTPWPNTARYCGLL